MRTSPDPAGCAVFADARRSAPSSFEVASAAPAAISSRSLAPAPARSSAARSDSLAERLDRRERRLAGSDPDQAGEAHLLGLVDEHVDLAARVAVAAGHHEAANHAAVGDDLLEDAELGVPEHIREVRDLEAEAQVGLVGPVPRDRLGVRHPAERQRAHSRADLLEDLLHERLDQRRKSSSGCANDISTSTCVNSSCRSARWSSSRKQRTIWK